jgi:DoxX-like family
MTSISLHQSASVRSGTRLWIAQGVLAALFLFAGVMKLVMPADVLAAQSHFPGAFMKFIGIAETAGALGLILPGLFRIGRGLTPLAALGLVIIMVGAVVTTIVQGQGPAAIVPGIVGVLAAYVARGRSAKA